MARWCVLAALLAAAPLPALGGGSQFKFIAGDSIVRQLPTGNMFGTYSYLLGDLKTGEAAVIDSGGNTKKMLEFATFYSLNITKLLQTHAHVDHIQGLPAMKAALPHASLHLHPDDKDLYTNMKGIPLGGTGGGLAQTAAFAVLSLDLAPLPTPDVWMKDGDLIQVGGVSLRVIHTPGHSPGHVCFHAEEIGVLFAGDLVMGAGVGRTDLAGGDFEALKHSVARLTQEVTKPETVVLSGHALPRTLEQLAEVNQFVTLPKTPPAQREKPASEAAAAAEQASPPSAPSSEPSAQEEL